MAIAPTSILLILRYLEIEDYLIVSISLNFVTDVLEIKNQFISRKSDLNEK